jgi:glycosyltransferase involved in cell wall biosynthesis
MEDKSTKFPLLSVIVPVYNGEKIIAQLLENLLLNQVSHNIPLEIIFIDDASTDRTVDIIEKFKYAGVKLIKLKTNKGTSAARNVGIRNSNGELVIFIDSDDALGNNFFNKLDNAYDPGIDCYLFDMIWQYNDFCLLYTFIKNQTDKRNLIRIGSVCNKVFRKDKLPEFEESMRFYEDTHFMFKVLSMNHNLNVKYIPDVCYMYNRLNENSKSTSFHSYDYLKVKKEIFELCKKGDKATQMICLETYAGVLFTTNYPIIIKLKVALSAIFTFPELIISVLKDPVKNNMIIKRI